MRRLCLLLCLTGTQAFAQNQLTQYLSLTSTQVSTILTLNRTFYSYRNQQNNRISGYNTQISNQYASGAPDLSQLGLAYAAIELIRRDVFSHEADLKAQVAAQLTPAQTTLVQTLSDSVILRGLTYDANCALLVNPPLQNSSLSSGSAFASFLLGAPAQWLDTTSFVQNPYLPSPPTATFCGSNTFPVDVREYLSLTDGQVSALADLSASYNDFYSRQDTALTDLYFQIRDETAKLAPDPVVLGGAYARLEAIGQSIQQMASSLTAKAQALLTPQQSARLQLLQNAESQRTRVDSAASCHFAVTPPGTGSAGFYSGCSL